MTNQSKGFRFTTEILLAALAMIMGGIVAHFTDATRAEHAILCALAYIYMKT